MRPIEPTEECDPLGVECRRAVYAEGQPEYNNLPAVITDKGAVITEWEPTPEERKTIAEGGSVKVVVLTFGRPLQPLLLRTGKVEPEDVAL